MIFLMMINSSLFLIVSYILHYYALSFTIRNIL